MTNNLPAPTRISAPPVVRPRIVPKSQPTGPQIVDNTSASPAPYIDENNVPRLSLFFNEIKSKLAEAKRELQSKPQTIASEDPNS